MIYKQNHMGKEEPPHIQYCHGAGDPKVVWGWGPQGVWGWGPQGAWGLGSQVRKAGDPLYVTSDQVNMTTAYLQALRDFLRGFCFLSFSI